MMNCRSITSHLSLLESKKIPTIYDFCVMTKKKSYRVTTKSSQVSSCDETWEYSSVFNKGNKIILRK